MDVSDNTEEGELKGVSTSESKLKMQTADITGFNPRGGRRGASAPQGFQLPPQTYYDTITLNSI